VNYLYEMSISEQLTADEAKAIISGGLRIASRSVCCADASTGNNAIISASATTHGDGRNTYVDFIALPPLKWRKLEFPRTLAALPKSRRQRAGRLCQRRRLRSRAKNTLFFSALRTA
jgi:hypothetical protein